MRQQRQPERRQHRHGHAQIPFADVRELVNAGWTQKAFEAEHAGPGQRREIGGVARHDAAPETDIDVTSAMGGATLGVQAGHGRGRRNAVQRHVDERRDAARRRRARRRLEPFPIGAAWVVDMNVGVNQAGQHDVGARIDFADAGRPIRMRTDRHDPPVADVDRRRPHAVSATTTQFAPND